MVDETAKLLLAKAIELVAAQPTRRTVAATVIYGALGWDWQRQQPNAYRLAAALEAEGLISYTLKRNNILIQPTKKGSIGYMAAHYRRCSIACCPSTAEA